MNGRTPIGFFFGHFFYSKWFFTCTLASMLLAHHFSNMKHVIDGSIIAICENPHLEQTVAAVVLWFLFELFQRTGKKIKTEMNGKQKKLPLKSLRSGTRNDRWNAFAVFAWRRERKRKKCITQTHAVKQSRLRRWRHALMNRHRSSTEIGEKMLFFFFGRRCRGCWCVAHWIGWI